MTKPPSPVPPPAPTLDGPAETPRLDRRTLLGGGLALSALGLGASASWLGAASPEPSLPAPASLPSGAERRLREVYESRLEAAEAMAGRPVAEHRSNGDEEEVPGYAACFSKSLPHDRLGRVDPAAYRVLRAALADGDPERFEHVPLGGYAKLANPQAALAYDLVGPDPVQIAAPPAPAFASPEMAAETVELYWHSLLRDLPFSQYEDDPVVARACAELSGLDRFAGPRTDRRVTPATLFRGPAAGDLAGPYVSQFLAKPIPFLPMWVEQAMRTTVPGLDFLGRYDRWLEIQNGSLGGVNRFEDRPLYVRNGRDLAEYVHRDFSYQAYMGAGLILFKSGVPADGGNPYKHSRTQSPFATYGLPYVLSLLATAAQLALKASWYQKWRIHRRLRPEEMGGRVENHLAGRLELPIHRDLLDSEAVATSHERFGTRLLTSAYAEGCPIHPSYPAAHAVIAGACVTVLKAFFDESYGVPEPVEATPDGRSLRPYEGPTLTVGGELDKLASNISIGRDFAAVHYRSDSEAGMAMGEAIALAMLEEASAVGNEIFAGFSVRRFDGRRIEVGTGA